MECHQIAKFPIEIETGLFPVRRAFHKLLVFRVFDERLQFIFINNRQSTVFVYLFNDRKSRIAHYHDFYQEMQNHYFADQWLGLVCAQRRA